ncbi:MAG TPA: hypothetical protein VGC21_03810 [Telluria sp.]|jgi:hypothetical protein
MKIIAQKAGKTDKLDRLRYLRQDGSSTETAMPRQGILPHDLVHFVVETQLGLQNGFTGLVARGANASFAMETTHEPIGKDVAAEAIQVEGIVEALQTQLWSGQFSAGDFLEGVRTACLMRATPAFEFASPATGQRLFDAALELDAQWQAVPFYGSLTVDFPV